MSDRFEVIDNEKAIELGLAEKDRLHPYRFWWLVVENMPDGSKRIVGEDGGEPEDQLLVRDWKWVATALNDAYEAGLADAARYKRMADYAPRSQDEDACGGCRDGKHTTCKRGGCTCEICLD